ncbi:hypothetical protein E4K10_01560 [Streptomyces sp. T1317-0309]|nr:hypothetical protein E4K10_01560 [Streptomyces sp. T1317-0309]
MADGAGSWDAPPSERNWTSTGCGPVPRSTSARAVAGPVSREQPVGRGGPHLPVLGCRWAVETSSVYGRGACWTMTRPIPRSGSRARRIAAGLSRPRPR